MKPIALLLALMFAAPIAAQQPKGVTKSTPPLTGVITSFADGDTYWLQPTEGKPVKVREWVADAPEISRSKKQPSQPGSQEALDYAAKHYKGKQVTVTVKGQSYGRVVGETVADGKEGTLGLDLVATGNAWVYPQARPRPTKKHKDAEAAAMEKKLGVHKDSQAVKPWEWRANQRGRRR